VTAFFLYLRHRAPLPGGARKPLKALNLDDSAPLFAISLFDFAKSLKTQRLANSTRLSSVAQRLFCTSSLAAVYRLSSEVQQLSKIKKRPRIMAVGCIITYVSRRQKRSADRHSFSLTYCERLHYHALYSLFFGEVCGHITDALSISRSLARQFPVSFPAFCVSRML
jgi:hypothetical protein